VEGVVEAGSPAGGPPPSLVRRRAPGGSPPTAAEGLGRELGQLPARVDVRRALDERAHEPAAEVRQPRRDASRRARTRGSARRRARRRRVPVSRGSAAPGTRTCSAPCPRPPGTPSCTPCTPGRGRAPPAPPRSSSPAGCRASPRAALFARPRVECSSSSVTMKEGHIVPGVQLPADGHPVALLHRLVPAAVRRVVEEGLGRGGAVLLAEAQVLRHPLVPAGRSCPGSSALRVEDPLDLAVQLHDLRAEHQRQELERERPSPCSPESEPPNSTTSSAMSRRSPACAARPRRASGSGPRGCGGTPAPRGRRSRAWCRGGGRSPRSGGCRRPASPARCRCPPRTPAA
jgi:hypothetical protein